MPGRVLIVDDDRDMCELLDAALRLRGHETISCTTAGGALDRLKTESIDVVLTDLNMPGTGGIELCARIVANRRDVPVVVMTAFGSLETAVAAIRAGAYDFVTKPIEMEVLALVLQRALDHRNLTERVRVLDQELERSRRFEELSGSSHAMQDVYDCLVRVADSDMSVLLTGEHGTGKELAARALHARGGRRAKPFVAVNCAALPESLLESELFGHARGAFTDARTEHKGLFVQASGGTLLLDEIGDLPRSLQPKLLRVLEERHVRPIGGDMEVPFDVRVIAATNQDLEESVEQGRFRADLFYRLNVIQIEMPPLRVRGTDILLLAQHFLERAAAREGRGALGLSEAVAERLLNYRWPGNVRELRNAIERAVALTRSDRIVVEDLPERIRAYRSTDLVLGADDPACLDTLDNVERRYITHVLRTVGDNRTQAARILGLDRKTLYRKLQRYDQTDRSD